MGPNQPPGEAGHRGILFRGANDDLWFMRDDSNAPVNLDQAMTNEINQVLGSETRWVNLPLAPVIAILNKQFSPLIQPDGVIHHRAQ